MEEEVEFVGEKFVWKSTESKPFAFGGNSEIYLVTSSAIQGSYALKIIKNDKVDLIIIVSQAQNIVTCIMSMRLLSFKEV